MIRMLPAAALNATILAQEPEFNKNGLSSTKTVLAQPEYKNNTTTSNSPSSTPDWPVSCESSHSSSIQQECAEGAHFGRNGTRTTRGTELEQLVVASAAAPARWR